VPNGIDADRFSKPAARPSGLASSDRYVLYVGRLEPRKGVEHLIQAMAHVQRTREAVRLLVVGDGPDRESLERAAGDAGINAIFTGRVPDTELPGYYQSADVVCSPALGDESFGLVLLEAMAAGRPIVATRIAGYAELLEMTGCARPVTPGNAEGLACEIAALLDDPTRARDLGGRGLCAVRKYDWNTIAARLDEIYRGVSLV